MSTFPPFFPSSVLASQRLAWFVRLLALVGAGLCGYLLYLKFSGQVSSIQGCGGAGGCGQVLGGEWSQWMGIPVSAMALGLYVAVFVLSFRRTHEILGRSADVMLCAASFMVLLSALWFVGLLAFQKHFCPYCAAAHAIGAVFAIPLLLSAFRQRGETGSGLIISAGFTAITAFVLLVLGQIFGPKPPTQVVSEIQLAQGAVQTKVADLHPVTGLTLTNRQVAFFDGKFTYSIDELPVVGSRQAAHVVVKYFDYTCGSCRDMHGDFQKIDRLMPGKFAVIVLPAPLNRTCNPHLHRSLPDHPQACESARLSLVVWRAAPGRFVEFHDFLMTLPLPLDMAKAEATARAMTSPSAFETASADPWVEARLKANIADYGAIILGQKNLQMPKLLLRDNLVLDGIDPNTEAMIQRLKTVFNLP